MAECIACGERISPDEHFCGNCGTQQLPINAELRTIAADLSEDLRVQADIPAQVAARPGSEPIATGDPKPNSSASLGGSYTDTVYQGETSAPPRGTGGKRPAVKQLETNTILNHRYEIVRRIGGRGMGARSLPHERKLRRASRA